MIVSPGLDEYNAKFILFTQLCVEKQTYIAYLHLDKKLIIGILLFQNMFFTCPLEGFSRKIQRAYKQVQLKKIEYCG